MPKYTVECRICEYVTVTVEAEDASAARDMALEVVCQSEKPYEEFEGWTDGWETCGCEKEDV